MVGVRSGESSPSARALDVPTPGTTQLIDVQQQRLGVNRRAAASSSSDIILLPAPSTDPDDPLNWSPRRKALSLACMCVYTVVIGISASILYSVIVPLSKDTGLTVGQLNSGTGYAFLLYGWGCLISQPVALQYGKRPVYLISLLATLAILLWQPHTTSNGQWVASKILQGFFGSPTETLCEISVADVFFQHERGTYVGLFTFMLAGSNFFAPIISGFINDGMGWQWVFYWSAIFLGLGFAFCFFFWEETNYDRGHPDLSASRLSAPQADMRDFGDAKEGGLEHGLDDGRPQDSDSKSQTLVSQPPAAAPKKSSHQRKPYLQKLSVIPQRRPFYLWKMIPRPLLFLQLPVLAWAGFAYGGHVIWFNVLNATASSFLSAPPYNFRPSIVGLSYISPLIGTGLASLFTGKLGDALILRLARRNGGLFEPEQRLWLFSISALLFPFGLTLWGVGAAHGVHWFGLVFAMGLLGAANTVGVQLSVMYVIDSYRHLSGEGVVSVLVVRNTMSFAINYAITPWVDGMGRQNAFITAALVGLAQVSTFLLMIRYGKRLRESSRQKYWRFVEESSAMGLVH